MTLSKFHFNFHLVGGLMYYDNELSYIINLNVMQKSLM